MARAAKNAMPDRPPRKRTRVAIVDDHPVVREGLRAALDQPDLKVVGEAATGAAAIALAQSLEPDVLILDVQLPDRSGLEVLKTIKAARPKTAILLFTVCDDTETIRQAVLLGAAGYLSKDASGLELLSLIRRIAAGEQILDQSVMEDALRRARPEVQPPRDEFEEAIAVLSRQEREVFRLVLQGRSNKEITERTGASLNTVKSQIRSLLRKIGVSDRTQAILWAMRQGADRGLFMAKRPEEA